MDCCNQARVCAEMRTDEDTGCVGFGEWAERTMLTTCGGCAAVLISHGK